MINNKQVNLWRGTNPPPTIYHVWIYNNEKILLYNGEEWVLFVDDIETVNKIIALQKQVDTIQTDLDQVRKSTVNSKPITENPVLTGEDLLLNKNGQFVNSEQTITKTIQILDSMFQTLIIE